MENTQAVSQNPVVKLYQNKLQNSAPQTTSIEAEPKQIENGDKKVNKALIGLGIIGAAGIGAALILKGKTHSLSEINFNKGIATIGEDGKKFTGKIKHTYTEGKYKGGKVTLEYVDGVLQSSKISRQVTNKNNEKVHQEIVKTFETLENGNRKITINVNGKEESKIINLGELKNNTPEVENKGAQATKNPPKADTPKGKNQGTQATKNPPKADTPKGKNQGAQATKNPPKADTPKGKNQGTQATKNPPKADTPKGKNQGAQAPKNPSKNKKTGNNSSADSDIAGTIKDLAADAKKGLTSAMGELGNALKNLSQKTKK